MTEKNLHIVAAAKARFMRYGYAKTTMGDIAEEAGIARQTLYNAYANKDEILRVVVRDVGQATLNKVEEAWGTADSFSEKLTQFHELVPIMWYEEIRKAPDWAELLEGVHKAAAEVVCVLDADWVAALERVMRDHAPARSAEEISEMAEFFYVTSLNAKHGVTDTDHLRRVLATVRKATLALL